MSRKRELAKFYSGKTTRITADRTAAYLGALNFARTLAAGSGLERGWIRRYGTLVTSFASTELGVYHPPC
jgi:hypothetical protein